VRRKSRHITERNVRQVLSSVRWEKIKSLRKKVDERSIHYSLGGEQKSKQKISPVSKIASSNHRKGTKISMSEIGGGVAGRR